MPQEAARADGSFIVVSITPCVCKTPPNGVPVPYPITATFSDKAIESSNVNFAGKPAMMFRSRLTKCTGNEAGSMGGVKSQTFIGWCKPINHSPTVKVNGSWILFNEGENPQLMEMNCLGPQGTGNTIGQVIYTDAILAAEIGPEAFSNSPEVVPEIPEEKPFLNSIVSGGCFGGGEGGGGFGAILGSGGGASPLGALGALGDLAGIPGLGMAGSLAGLAAGSWSNPATWLQALNLGRQAAGLFSNDRKGNGGSFLGAASNLAAIAGPLSANPGERFPLPYHSTDLVEDNANKTGLWKSQPEMNGVAALLWSPAYGREQAIQPTPSIGKDGKVLAPEFGWQPIPETKKEMDYGMHQQTHRRSRLNGSARPEGRMVSDQHGNLAIASPAVGGIPDSTWEAIPRSPGSDDWPKA